jgi:rRNA-processing protein EBP2
LILLFLERKGALENAEADDDAFDIAVEDAISDKPAKRGKAVNGTKLPRHVRDKKFGFGGPGRRAKQNTKSSTDDFSSGLARRSGKGVTRGGGGAGRGAKRLGKSRRAKAR